MCNMTLAAMIRFWSLIRWSRISKIRSHQSLRLSTRITTNYVRSRSVDPITSYSVPSGQKITDQRSPRDPRIGSKIRSHQSLWNCVRNIIKQTRSRSINPITSYSVPKILVSGSVIFSWSVGLIKKQRPSISSYSWLESNKADPIKIGQRDHELFGPEWFSGQWSVIFSEFLRPIDLKFQGQILLTETFKTMCHITLAVMIGFWSPISWSPISKIRSHQSLRNSMGITTKKTRSKSVNPLPSYSVPSVALSRKATILHLFRLSLRLEHLSLCVCICEHTQWAIFLYGKFNLCSLRWDF